ncbi:DUF6531 domain-containing protein [Kitasatospora sp. NPDC094016]|uniref:DUF6531 domain-containing protein n=1 Tax=Kitasatospora sp. NPDC094016 TaxID=3154986 RepID=UPI00331668C2
MSGAERDALTKQATEENTHDQVADEGGTVAIRSTAAPTPSSPHAAAPDGITGQGDGVWPPSGWVDGRAGWGYFYMPSYQTAIWTIQSQDYYWQIPSVHYTVYRASDNAKIAENCFAADPSLGGSTKFWIEQVNRQGGNALQPGVGYYAKFAYSTNFTAGKDIRTEDWSCASGWSSEAQTPTLPAFSNGRTVPAAETTGCGCGDSSGRDQFQGHRGDPVNTLTRSENEQATDATLAAPGVPFALTRTYSSDAAAPANSPLGAHWSFPYSASVQDQGGSTVQVTLETGAQVTFNRDSSGNLTPTNGVRSVLTGSPTTGYRLTTLDKRTLGFDPSGRLTSWVDLNGAGLTLAYSGIQTTPSTITDSAGHVVTLTYAASSPLLTTVALPDGRSVGYGYTNRLLTSVTDLTGGTTTYAYDTAGRLTGITDPAGHQIMSTSYDANGLVVSQKDANGHTTAFTGNAAANGYSTYTDANGGQWSDYYTGSQLYRSVDPYGKKTAYAYDGNQRLSQVLDPDGHLTQFNYDAAGHLTTRTLADGSTESWTYDNAGNQTSHTTPGGAKTTATYDSANHLTSQTDPGGGKTAYTYTAKGQLASKTTPADRTTTYAYDTAGNLLSVTDPAGNRTSYTYDSAGRRMSVTDPRGNTAGANPAGYTTSYAYDNADRVLSITDASGGKTLHGYDSVGNRTSVTDPLGNKTAYTYDNAHHLLTSTDAAGNQTSYTYDANGNPLTRTDPTGAKSGYTYDSANRQLTTTTPRGNAAGATPATFTTTFGYDAKGNWTSTTDPTGAVTRTAYDALDRPVTATDPLGNTTTTGYDADGRITSTTDPTGAKTTSTYDPRGLLASVTDALGNTQAYGYDADGLRTSAVTPTGDRTTYAYGPNGEVSASTDPRGNVQGADPAGFTTSYSYDAAGNLTAAKNPLGNTFSTAYDALNRITALTDPLGGSTARGYDQAGHLTTVTDPTGATTSYTFDAADNRTSRSDGNGHTTRYAYDAAKRVLSVTDPLNRKTTYGYDADGNRTTVTGARGITATTGYDTRGLATGTTYSDNTPALAYTYDAAGRRTGIKDATGSRTLTYDAVGRLLTTSSPTTPSGFTYTYDAAGHVTSRQYPSGWKTTSTYDAAGRPASLTAGGATTTFGYDQAGHLTTTALPSNNGYTETRAYDQAGQLSAIASTKGGATLSSWGLTRNPAGLPVKVDTARSGLPNGALAYSYDPAGRLLSGCSAPSTGAGCLPGSELAYTYDKVGNRLTQTSGQAVTTYAYDDADQLTQAATGTTTTAYGYDPDGDTTSSKTFPSSTVLPSGGTIASGASLSSASVRLTMQADGNLVLFSILSGQVLWSSQTGGHLGATAALQNDGNLTVRDTAGAVLWSTQTSSGPGTYVKVQADANVVVYDANGKVQWSTNTWNAVNAAGASTYTYDAAGRLSGETIGANTFTYTYDNAGNRTATRQNGAAARTTQWDVNTPLPRIATETSGDGSLLGDYSYGPQGQLLSQHNGTDTYYSHHDWLGSVTDVTDSHGVQQTRYGYDTFGARSATNTAPNPPVNSFGFTGEHTDPADNLLNLRARRYDSSTGRLTTRDPIQLRPDRPYTADYVYTHNGPSYRTDPSGLCDGFLDCLSDVGGALTHIDVTVGVAETLFGAAVTELGADLTGLGMVSCPFTLGLGCAVAGVGVAVASTGLAITVDGIDRFANSFNQAFREEDQKSQGATGGRNDGSGNGGSRTNAEDTSGGFEDPTCPNTGSGPIVDPNAELPPQRQAYISEVEALKGKVGQMRAAGKSDEEIARTLHQARRDLGVKYKDATEEGKREAIYARNLTVYGDKLGPSIDWLRARGKSWQDIIDSAARTGGKDLGLGKR